MLLVDDKDSFLSTITLLSSCFLYLYISTSRGLVELIMSMMLPFWG
jgi:hypothetical protein